jgi:hypothetical protein
MFDKLITLHFILDVILNIQNVRTYIPEVLICLINFPLKINLKLGILFDFYHLVKRRVLLFFISIDCPHFHVSLFAREKVVKHFRSLSLYYKGDKKAVKRG